MTPEQREELKQAAQDLHNADDHTWPTYQARFERLVGPAAILSLIAQVEALTVPQWHPIKTAPADCILLLATEFFHEGDWRIKVGGYWNGGWDVFGASWTPTHWMPLPAAPTIPAIPGTKEGAK